MNEVYILSSSRTPTGSFGGELSTIPATELGATAIASACKKAGIGPEDHESRVIFGNVLSAGLGQAPARQAALKANLSVRVPCIAVNKVCGSSLHSVIIGSYAIQVGEAKIVVAGGMESMSQAPHLLMNSRTGHRLGAISLLDHMMHDGLTDAYSNQSMGSCAEMCAEKYNISREDMDEFAIRSFNRAIAATKDGSFQKEIAAQAVPQRHGEPVLITEDEGPSKVRFDRIPSLKPAFKENGRITAANASSINDGAAALVLAGPDLVKKHNLKPIARILSSGSWAHEPLWFTTAPEGVIRNVLKKAGLTPKDVDLWEINEAFAVVALNAMRTFDLDPERVNVHGGAIALGHPIGASGARILTTLLHALEKYDKKIGLATLCIGGGEANAVVIERL